VQVIPDGSLSLACAGDGSAMVAMEISASLAILSAVIDAFPSFARWPWPWPWHN
jgi:hypothetical protein